MERNVIQAVREALSEEMARDERVFILGQDVGKRGGVFRATEGLLEQFGERRVIDTPLSESVMVGVAIGAGAAGYRPIVEFQFADFIWPAMDQIVSEAAKLHYRSNGVWNCPIVIRAPYGAGIRGGLYHSQSVEAAFAHIPGLKVVTPATPADAKGLLKAAIRDDDPVIFLEHKRTYRAIKGDVPAGDVVVPIGQACVVRPGRDLTVISYGMTLHYCLQAAETVAASGVVVEVIDLRTIVPLDRATVLASVRKTGKALIVHEDTLTGGFGAELAATIAEEAFEHLDGPIRRITAPDVPAMPFNAALEDFCLPTVPKIEAAMLELARY